MENKYFKKLCTPEQNKTQTIALSILAVGLTVIFFLSLILD